MRRQARITLLLIGIAVLGLLALGALPQYIGGGETYRMTADPVDEPTTSASVNVAGLAEHRYPYVSGALATGTSDPYDTGIVTVKGWFTHTPFDEFSALEARNPDAVAEPDRVIYVSRDEQVYRVEIEREQP